jgi:hypothetical protein
MGPANTTQAPSFLTPHSNLQGQKKNCSHRLTPREGPKNAATTVGLGNERGPSLIPLPVGEGLGAGHLAKIHLNRSNKRTRATGRS